MPYGRVVNTTKICYRVTETIIVISATRRNSKYRKAKYAGRTVSETDITTATGALHDRNLHTISRDWDKTIYQQEKKKGNDVYLNAEKLQVSDMYVPLNECQQ